MPLHFDDVIGYGPVNEKSKDREFGTAIGITHYMFNLVLCTYDANILKHEWGKLQNGDIVTMIADFKDPSNKQLFFFRNDEALNKEGVSLPNDDKYESWYPCICVYKYGKYEILDEE